MATIVGVDRSVAMISAARSKVEAAGLERRITFVESDIGTPQPIVPCDAVLIMFSVLGYLTDHSVVDATLRSARAMVRDGALLIFDVWNAEAVRRNPPHQRWLMIDGGDRRLLRLASGSLNAACDICTVNFRVLELVGTQITKEITEEHCVRCFTNQQLAALLSRAGFELLRIGAFPDYRKDPELSNDWSVLVIARAVNPALKW